MRRTMATMATLLALVGLLAATAAPAAAGSPNAERDKVLKYWTAERLANARPRDFVRGADGTFRPNAKPPAPGGGVIKGASWTGGGAVLQKTGKVWFSMDGGDWVCSAAAVTNSRSGFSLIVTAGHCAYDEVNRAFATNWTYIPDFDYSPTFTCGSTHYGCWTTAGGGGLVVHNGYASAGGFNEQATIHDFAIAYVGNGGLNGTTQLETLGTFAISYPAISTGGSVHSFGYPAAGKYKGKDLTYCAGPTFDDQYNDDATWGIACNMTGGSSGGPWIANFGGNGSSGTLTSLNSYGYSGLSNMYGPKFNGDTQDVFNRANSGSTVGNVIVP